MPDPAQNCTECEAPATWFRCTQFAGTHPYCEIHARAETDFGKDDGHYFAWRTLQQLQEGEARVKAEQAAAAEAARTAAKARGDWIRITGLDGQPCSRDVVLWCLKLPGRAPARYRLALSHGTPSELQFHGDPLREPPGWTHQHLLLALINRLTAVQELKPLTERAAALDSLRDALTHLKEIP
jgi:hypothetical protein